MKLAYAKLARSFPTSRAEASNVGGDIEVINLLHHLLDDGHEVHLFGQTQRTPCDHPRASELLVNHWGHGPEFAYDRNMFRILVEAKRVREKCEDFDAYESWLDDCCDQLPDDFDDVIVWLGHHGTSLHPLPPLRKKVQSDTGYTTCQQNDLRYSYPIVHAINRRNWQPLYICPDPRNRMKFRDFSHRQTRKVMAQFNEGKEFKGYNPEEHRVFTMKSYYRYDGIETLAIDHLVDPLEFAPGNDAYVRLDDPPDSPFGLIVNEGYPYVSRDKRLKLVQEWCAPWMPRDDFAIYGTWTKSSASELESDMSIDAPPVEAKPYDDIISYLQGWRSTFTMPATATGWATAKPWECFIAGTVCFRHPRYDRQNHIYSPLKMPGDLANFLSPLSPMRLEERVNKMRNDEEAWKLRVGQQFDFLREHYNRGWTAVQERLGRVDK